MSVHWGGPGAGHVSRWSVATTGVPVLSLDFLTSNTLDPRVTFTRSTTATFVGSNGLIQTAAIDAPRFDYNPVTLVANGLLIEEQRVNLLRYSEQFNDAAWAKSNGSVTANTTTSPDGTTNADAFIENTAASAFHFINQAVAKAASSIVYAGSFYLKNKGRQVSFNLNNAAGSSGVQGRVNPTTGTVTQNATAFGTGFTAGAITITNVGNGWYRVVMTATSDTSTNITLQLALHNGTSNVYTGDGVSGAFLYGAQLEAGAFATSYIPTEASTVTRAADIALMTGTNFSSWYNQSAGTIVVQATAYGNKASSILTRIQDAAATTNFITARQSATGTQILGQTSSSGGLTAGLAATNFTIGAPFKIAVASAPSDVAASVNGGTVGTSTAMTTMPVVDRLNISEGGPFHIRSITYYSSRLTNAQLQALTA